MSDLENWCALYRRLWSRGTKTLNTPGKWARFYSDDLRALEAALEELKGDLDV